MSNWRNIALVAIVPVILVCLLLFTRGLRGGPDPSAGLSGKVESLIGDWTVKRVPLSERVVTLVIGDTGSGEDVLRSAPTSEDEGLLAKFQRIVGLRPSLRTAETPNPFAKAFTREPGALAWTFDGFSKADEKAVVEEIARSLVKAHDGQAVINIVAQGEIGAAVLKSLKSLEGQVRGGVQVGANSVVLMGMDKERLKAYDPVFFSQVSRPKNVIEWANVYSRYGEDIEKGMVEMFSAKYDGKALPGKYLAGLLPAENRASSTGLPVKLDALALGIIGVFSASGGLETWVSRQEYIAEREYERQRREYEMELARKRAEEEARMRAEEDAKRRAREEAERRARERDQSLARAAKIQWVSIPGGSFTMGSAGGESDEKPVHRVTVKSFQMAKSEVTRGQYQACVEAGRCRAPSCEWPPTSATQDHPVVCVDWNDARTFSGWAGGRLPSEAEWEYAARSAGRDIEYPWGDEQASCARAVMDNGCGRKSTWPVCSKTSGNTRQGLCDMAGNVWEWTQDWYHSSYNGAPSDGSAWERPAGSGRVLRGGSWRNLAGYLRAAYRDYHDPGHRNADSGFRPVQYRSTEGREPAVPEFVVP